MYIKLGDKYKDNLYHIDVIYHIDNINEEIKAQCIQYTDNIPETPIVEGKVAHLIFDNENNKFDFYYTDFEDVSSKIAFLEKTVSNLLLEIATMKAGV